MTWTRTVRAAVDWKSFDGDRIILPICARSPGAKGRNFQATVAALRGRVRHVHMILCDTLDRYNLGGDATAAKAAMDGWLSTALPQIAENFTFDLKRWDDVRDDPGFMPRLALMTELYRSSPEARQAIDRIANYYIDGAEKRADKTGLPFNRLHQAERSAVYLIEEFAGTAVYGAWHPGLPEAYWGVYVGDPQIFNRCNVIDPSVDLTLPATLPVRINRLGPAIAGEVPRAVA